jgi:quercetin dioxygenase-like cupin family protein
VSTTEAPASPADTESRLLDTLFEGAPGAHIIAPRNSSHSWRNISDKESRLLAIITPGGFDQIADEVSTTPADTIHDLAA